MTAEEYRALLDVDFNNVKIEDLTLSLIHI